ncbi:MAG TPA: hypothetical protein VNZ53_09960, partial [Steroidobacteraceae bacterium]|nr:hypothetical protein [Steroidobacteraceae bacterium]
PNLLAKVPYWEALIAALSSQSASHALAIGDFNTCRAYVDEAGAIDATAHYMDPADTERFALRNLLAKTIETSRHSLSRRILTLKAILAKLGPILAPSSRSHPAHEP